MLSAIHFYSNFIASTHADITSTRMRAKLTVQRVYTKSFKLNSLYFAAANALSLHDQTTQVLNNAEILCIGVR